MNVYGRTFVNGERVKGPLLGQYLAVVADGGFYVAVLCDDGTISFERSNDVLLVPVRYADTLSPDLKYPGAGVRLQPR